MPLDPAKLQQVVDKADGITKRFDALTARRAKADEDKAQRNRFCATLKRLTLKTAKPDALPPDMSDRTLEQPTRSSRPLVLYRSGVGI